MKKTQYYLEAEAGVAGDMLVGALLDLGADEKKLLRVISTLPVDGYEIKISRVKKAGIDALDFNVILDEAHDGHDHDMEYLHGSGHIGEHHHHDGDGHAHGEHHHHEHRHLSDIYSIIDSGDMTEKARKIAKDIFRIVAEAESKAHDMPVDEVHFHEVGAVDSIIDIVSIAVCVDDLDIDGLVVPYLREGCGSIRCQHGILPIPVPAVEHILGDYDIPLRRIDADGEFVTPTGAAACAALMKTTSLPTEYTIKRTGYGAGKRDYERASVLRIMEIEATGETASGGTGKEHFPEAEDFVWKLETDIDDCTGERLGYLMDILYAANAREVHFVPIQMKKNRPGVELVVLCDEEKREKIEDIIFIETSTIGIRRSRLQRTVLPREELTLDTISGPLDVKVVTLPNGTKRGYPEYDSVRDMALNNKMPLSEAWELCEKYISVAIK